MILARNARSIRAGESIAGWLYRVAHRTAISARRRSLKRREERLATEPPAPPEKEFPDLIGRQMVGLLLEELHRLPAKYQTPLVMRYLEGRSRRSIAEATDTTIATVQGQLARGKKLLRSRLVRRGVSLSAAMAIVGGTSRVEATPFHLITQTTADMSALALGSGSLAASATVLTLYREGARLMFFASLTKPALATTGVLLMTLLATPLLADGNEGTAPVPIATAPTLLLDASVTEPAIEAPPAMPLLIAQAYGAGEESGATAGLPSRAEAKAGSQPEFKLKIEEPFDFDALFTEFNRTLKQMRKKSDLAKKIDAMLGHLPEDSPQRKALDAKTAQIQKEVEQWITQQNPELIPQLIQAAAQADSENADKPEERNGDMDMEMGMGRGMEMGGQTTCLDRLGNSLTEYGQLKKIAGVRHIMFSIVPLDSYITVHGSQVGEVDKVHKVDPLGMVDLGQPYGEVNIGGKTFAEARRLISGRVNRHRVGFMNPQVQVLPGKPAHIDEASTSFPLLDKPAGPPSGMDPFGDYGGETSSTPYDARDSLSNHAAQPIRPAVPPADSSSNDQGRWRVLHKPSAVNPDGWATIAEVKVGATVPFLLPNDQRPRPHLKIIEIGDEGCSFRIENSQGALRTKLYPLHSNMTRIEKIGGQKVQINWIAGSRETHALIVLRQITGAGYGSTPRNMKKFVRHLLDNPKEPDPAPLPPDYNLGPDSPASATWTPIYGHGGYRGRSADYGYSVETLQKALNEQLDPSPQLDVDGQYGPRTDAAVRRFQEQEGLIPDGNAGPRTRHTLGLTDPPVGDRSRRPSSVPAVPMSGYRAPYRPLLDKPAVPPAVPPAASPAPAVSPLQDKPIDIEKYLSMYYSGIEAWIKDPHGPKMSREEARRTMLYAVSGKPREEMPREFPSRSVKRGWERFFKGLFPESETEFRFSLEEDDERHLLAINGLGFALLNQGKTKEAKPLFEEFLRRESMAPGPLHGLACCLAAEGDREGAIRIWEEAIKIKPGPWMSSLAKAYCEQKEYAKAVPLLEMLVKAVPRDKTFSDELEEAKKGLAKQ